MVDEPRDSGKTVEGCPNAGFVEVMYAQSPDEAAGCRELLEDRSIPARVENSNLAARRCGIAVLVPSDFLVEACELLISRAQDDGDIEDDPSDDDIDEIKDDFDGDDDDDEDDEDF